MFYILLQRSSGEGLLHILGKIINKVDWQQLEYHPEQIILHPDYVEGGETTLTF